MTGPRPYDARGLRNHAAVLDAALDRWQARDDTKPQPEARRAASMAVDAIDQMLRELYLMRGRLVTEIRASDDATEVRARALLGRTRQLRAAAPAAEES